MVPIDVAFFAMSRYNYLMITQEQKDILRKKLLEEKALLESELSDIGSENKKTGDWQAVPEATEGASDDNDLADRFEDFDERSGTMNALEPRLASIDEALVKLDNGDNTYGVCSVCENDIETERLLANPAATTCMSHMN